jgi:hypothetical protein
VNSKKERKVNNEIIELKSPSTDSTCRGNITHESLVQKGVSKNRWEILATDQPVNKRTRGLLRGRKG